MPRPKKDRLVHGPPLFAGFKPVGISSRDLKETILSLDEFEALRLADLLHMSQEEAAEEMEISRPTFTRLIEKAREKLAEFVINGRLLTIEGGNIHFRSNTIQCQNCGHMFNISIDKTISECPECQSTRLISLAGGFGHGKCCMNRNQKTGGNYARRRQNRT